MLTQMRTLSQNWFGRAIMAVVLAFIIGSFAIWGIGDRFNNFNASELAEVGATRISVDDYRNAYQNQLQQMQQKEKRAITNDEARRTGLDRQVLSRLLTDSILDQQAKSLGLAVGDDEIARQIAADDIFKGPTGKFDQMRFAGLLRDNGYTEGAYVKAQRALMLRQDVSDAVIGGVEVPDIVKDVIHRYQSEVRDLDFFILPPSAAGTVPAPSEAELKTFYDEHATSFVAPEFRKLVILSIVPANLVKPDAVTDDDVKKRYEEVKAQRFFVPEKRTVQQLVFADQKAAEAAAAKLKGGESFDKVVSDEKKNPADIGLGTIARDELADTAVAAAAFALPEGGTSAPVKGQFGTVLVHVTKIYPSREQPLIEVSAALKDEVAIVRARRDATRMRDQIEDQRASGKTLTEAAKSVGLDPRKIDAVDAQGRDRAHKPIEGLVDGPTLLKSAFATEVGADTEMIKTTNGGDVWYEVAGITPSHQLPLAEIKPRVEDGWRKSEIARRLAAEGDKLVKQIDGGKSLADVAAAAGKQQVLKATNVERVGAPNLPPTVTSAIFDVPAGKAGSVSDFSHGRIVFAVTAAKVPPIEPKNEDWTKLMAQVKGGFEDDVIAQYLGKVQGEIGVKINQQALKTALGGNEPGT